jgi:DNA-binding protein H-NS
MSIDFLGVWPIRDGDQSGRSIRQLTVISMNNLKSMSIDKLMKLREQVDAVLGAKISEERRTLEERLGNLGRLTANGSGRKRMGGGARGSVAPKYRNPDNPAETWAGRGLKPRWLSAAIKAGKKIEDFSIEATGKKTRSAPRKTRQKGGQSRHVEA